MSDFLEVSVQWYGPIPLERVELGEFTQGMLSESISVYHWGTEEASLYIGKAVDVAARQRQHLRDTLGENLRQARRRGHEPLFWCGPVMCGEFCGRVTERRASEILSVVERALIVKTDPRWNRVDRGYGEFEEPIRVVSGGRRPPSVARTIRLKGRHVRF